MKSVSGHQGIGAGLGGRQLSPSLFCFLAVSHLEAWFSPRSTVNRTMRHPIYASALVMSQHRRFDSSKHFHGRWSQNLRLTGVVRCPLAIIVLATVLGAASSAPCAAQPEQRPLIRNVTPQSEIRTRRLRVPHEFFKEEAVRFKRAHVDMSGSIRADGHNLMLYGAVLLSRNRICTSAEGARWACGQRAFIVLRKLLDGQSITCSFRRIHGPA